MKKLACAIAMAGALGASSAFAVEDSEWGAWASTDSDALLRILAAQHNDGTDQPFLGSEDSALLDAGSLLLGILNSLSDTTGLSLEELLDPDNLVFVNELITQLPVDVDVGGLTEGTTALAAETFSVDEADIPGGFPDGLDEDFEDIIDPPPIIP